MVLVLASPPRFVWICCPLLPRRYVISFLCFLALSMSFVLRICMGQLIKEMSQGHHNVQSWGVSRISQVKVLYTTDHETKPNEGSNWDVDTKDIILSAFCWTYPLSHLTGGLLAERISARLTLAFSLLVSAVCSLLTPAVVWRLGAKGLVAIQVVMGLGQGFIYPCLNVLLSKWAPLEERASLSSFVYSGEIFGIILTLSCTDAVLHWVDNKWQYVFYAFGAGGIVMVVVWTLVVYNKPEAYPGISMREKVYLQKHPLPTGFTEQLPPTPWTQMLTSVPVWALIITKAGSDWGQYTVINGLPRYSKEVLVCPFNGTQLPWWPAFPYVVMFVVSVISGVISDCLVSNKIISLTFSRMLFVTLGSLGAALSLMGALYSGCSQDITFFILGMGVYGFFYPGIKVNILDLSSDYSGTVMALVNGIASLLDAIRPYVIEFFITDYTRQRWIDVFFITAAIFVGSNLVFLVMGSAEVQPWNSPPQVHVMRPRLRTVSYANSPPAQNMRLRLSNASYVTDKNEEV